MQIIRGLHNLRPEHHGCVATIGNFDGVHLGHQAVFRHLRAKGAELGMPCTVITFEPQPQEFFAPVSAPPRLTRLREKLQVIHDSGIDRVMLLEFGPKLARMSAAEFVKVLLARGLGVRLLFVGDDFRFGKGREGDVGFLQKAGAEYGFEVESMDTYKQDSCRVSSTRIREALSAGQLKAAAQCLGRTYRICGRVGHGNKQGRRIGFPTANINLHRRASPLHGVFAVMVHGIERRPLPGVANIGTRPTVDGDSRYLLEVHLFDFSRDVYGKHVEVEFCSKIRDEKRFDSFDELRRQIANDAETAREYLRITATNPAA